MLEPTLGHAVACVRRQGLRRMIGEYHPRQAEEGGGARDRAEVVRVAHPIEDEERLSVVRPLCRGLGVERMDRLGPRDRNDTAMQHRAGDTIELISADQTERLV